MEMYENSAVISRVRIGCSAASLSEWDLAQFVDEHVDQLWHALNHDDARNHLKIIVNSPFCLIFDWMRSERLPVRIHAD
jgi:plasmid maintenance system killer protein